MIGLALAAMIVCPTMTSCGDDDDDDNAGGNGNNGSAVTFDGQQLLSAGRYNFSYDDKGRCTEINSGYGMLVEIDYNKGLLVNEDEELKVKFNGKGYISELSEKFEERDGSDYYKTDAKMSLNYDKAGHLLSINISVKESGKEDGEVFTFSAEGKATYTWTNGNMVAGEFITNYNDDGDKGIETTVYTITYGDQPNEFNQYTYALATNVIELDDMPLAMVGLIGVGPANLPSKIAVEYSDTYDDDDYSESLSSTFTLNNNGTVASERMSYNGYYQQTLNYNYGSVASKAGAVSDMAEKLLPIKKHTKFSMRRHARR